MIIRRIVYGLLLIGMLAFHVFYSGAIAWYLLLLTILLPVASRLFTLPKKRKIDISFDIPESVNIGEEAHASVNVRGKTPLPIGCVSFSFELMNETNGRSTSKKKLTIYGCHNSCITFPVRTDECGRIKCTLTKLRMFDYLGIFSRTYKEKHILFINVFPVPEPPSPIPELPIGDLMGITSKPKPGGGFAEDYDVRGYRPGDPVNLIHWKLTSKRDDIMIREPLITERGKALLTFNLYGEPAVVGKTFGYLSWCVLWLLQYSIQPHIKWYDNSNSCEHTVQIESHIEFIALMIQLFSKKIPFKGQSVAGEKYEGFVWRYHIDVKTFEDTHPGGHKHDE